MIPLIKSTFYQERKTKQALKKFISDQPILSFNKECQRFEKKFGKWQGRKYVTFVNSGSSANLAVVQSLLNLGRLQPGDKVGFSTLTWSTNVMPLIQLGLKPVPIDIELSTLNISNRTVKETLEKHDLKMIFITNLLGFCDDIDQIQKICNKENIIFIEDNCESLGTVYKGRKLGNYGVASTFSFYVGHHMSTIEGGAVTTDDEELASMLQVVRAHGWDRNMSEAEQQQIRKKHRINSTFYSRYTFYDLGYNLRPTEINGFIGNTQIPYLDEIISKREDNYHLFSQIYQNDQYYPIETDHIELVSNFAVPVVCKSVEQRDELVKKCNKVVEIRPIVGGDITQQPFFTKYQRSIKAYQKTNAYLAHQQGLYFANNPELTKKEINTILEVFV